MADADHRSIRRRIREFVWPVWLTMPLLFLGLVFLSLPFVPLNSWFDYFLGLAVAIALGV